MRRPPVRAMLLAAAGAALLLLVAPTAAWAHASFVSSTPSPGSGLPTAPGEVVLRFTEPLVEGPSTIEVVDDTGADVTDGPTEPVAGDDRAMRRSLGLLAPGVYTVEWTTVSPLDGHTLSGSYRFAIGQTTLGETAVAADPLSSEGPLGLAGRFLALAGLALWFGLAVISRRAADLGVPDHRLRVLLVAGPSLALVGTAASLVSTSLVASGGLGAVWTVVTGGRSGLLRAGVMAAAGLRLATLQRAGRGTAVSLGAIAVVAEAASGHAGSNPQPWLATATFAVHLAAAGVWVAAVAAAAAAGRLVAEVLRGLTPAALAAGGIVGLSGVGSAALELTGPADLTATGYGRAVLAKGGIFAAVALAGAAHHLRRRRGAGADRLHRPVRVELVALASAVGIATVLVGFPNPPREAATATLANDPTSVLEQTLAGGAVTTAGRSGKYVVGVTVAPPRPGPVDVLVQLLGVDAADSIRGVRIEASGPDGTERTVSLDDCGLGCFRARDVDLEARGTWELSVRATTSSTPVEATVMVPLPAPDGRRAYQAMLDGMAEVNTARAVEELRPTADADPIVSHYTYRAPDEFRWEVTPASDTPKGIRMAFGDTGYRRSDPTEDWERYDWIGEPFSWPAGYYESFFTAATAFRVLGETTIDGVPTRIISFVQPRYPAWYRLWIDDHDRIRRLEMLTDGHFMDQTYSSYGEPVDLEPPVPDARMQRPEAVADSAP